MNLLFENLILCIRTGNQIGIILFVYSSVYIDVLALLLNVFQMLHLSLKELNRQFGKGTLSSVTLLEQSFKRLDLIKELNVFICECRDEALEAAKKSDKHRAESKPRPLEGVTVAVKDNFCVKGTKTTCGSKMLNNFIAPYNATVVEKSINAGGIIIGKTNLDEFAMGSGTTDSYFGPTKNIWRSGIEYRLQDENGNDVGDTGGLDGTWAVAGGSSGGSAVAVAAGAAVVSLGSDTGGSVRIPAAWCGIPSLKPSYGLLSRHGLIPLVNSLDVPGLMARSVKDLETFFTVLSGRDVMDSTTLDYRCSDLETSLDKIKFGVPQEYYCEGMTSEVLQSLSEVCVMLEESGSSVVSTSLPNTNLAVPCYSVLNPCEVASNMARYDGLEFGFRGEDESSTDALYASSRSSGFNEVVRGRILAGNYFLLKKHYDEYFLQGLKLRRLVLNDFLRCWNAVDFLVTPVSLSDAPSYSEYIREDNRTQTAKQDHCTLPVNLAGLPAVTVPVKLSSRSLPLSVQIIGPYGSDFKLLKLAKILEAKVKFPTMILRGYDS